MLLLEYICGLLPVGDFAFPDGLFNVRVLEKKYQLLCHRVCLLKKKIFTLNEEINSLYLQLDSLDCDFINKFPYLKDQGIVISAECLTSQLCKHFRDDQEKIRQVRPLVESHYHVCVIIEHFVEDGKYSAPIEYIRTTRDGDKMAACEDIFFSTIREFYDYLTILRAPYINTIELSVYTIRDVFAYFCDENYRIITNIRPLKYDCFTPRFTGEENRLRDFLNKDIDIPIEDLFIAKAKVYLRLHDYPMAIIHSVIALDVIVPNYVNAYLKTRGVSKDSIKDFDNKFGLSVRVKALLKVILPEELHGLLTRVGIAINYRNRIMHDGATNSFFVKNGINVENVVNDCEALVTHLKERQAYL